MQYNINQHQQVFKLKKLHYFIGYLHLHAQVCRTLIFNIYVQQYISNAKIKLACNNCLLSDTNLSIKAMCLYTCEGIPCQEQYPPNKLLVVVEGMEIGGGYVVHPGPGVGVGDGRVNWYQVHIMHSDIITVFATLQESNIDQRRSVKPKENMMYTSSLTTDH